MAGKTGSGFDGSKWYANKMHRRTKAALREKEQAFCAEHENDTREDLLVYLVSQARELKHPPRAIEVLGASLICRRFGSWAAAMKAAGFSRACGPQELSRTRLYREEYERQQELYRREKNERKMTEKNTKTNGGG